MMEFAVRTADTVHVARGTNIIPGFPAGTKLLACSVNGYWAPFANLEADGEDIVIAPAYIRRALAAGAPKTLAPRAVNFEMFNNRSRSVPVNNDAA